MAHLPTAALWYAQRGIAVFPLIPMGKTPATKNGFKDASTDPVTVRDWWTRMPTANIGLPTGLTFDVIDLDGPEGIASSVELEDDGPLDDPLAIVHTPRGFHYYLPPSGAGCTVGVLPGIDYRGVGGYVVAPPSVREDGGGWTWVQQINP